MDNVRTHKVAGVRETIEAAAAQLRYLPAYSPDLNPIENAYAKIKSDLRKGAARTALWKLVGLSVKAIAPLQSAAGTQTGHPVLAADSDRNAGQRTKGLASLPRSSPVEGISRNDLGGLTLEEGPGRRQLRPSEMNAEAAHEPQRGLRQARRCTHGNTGMEAFSDARRRAAYARQDRWRGGACDLNRSLRTRQPLLTPCARRW
jgi:hypothetical protein